jgi:ParB family transcriptional regulator, chromosome partitioning protein
VTRIEPLPGTAHPEMEKLKPEEKELARHKDREKIRQVADSLLQKGQLQQILVVEDGRIIAGHLRYLAAKLAGMKTLEAKVYPATITDAQFLTLRCVENLLREDYTPYERFIRCSDLMTFNTGWQLKDLAEALHLSASEASKIMAAAKCVQEVLDAFRDGKIGHSDVYLISRVSHAEQHALLAKKLGGANRDAIEAAVQEAAKPKGAKPPEERIARVRIPLAVKTDEVKAFGTVTVSGTAGAEVDLKETENLLSEALKAVRDAKKRGYGVKAAQAAWKDVAKVEA